MIMSGVKSVVVGRLNEGDDLLDELTNVVRELEIFGGAVQVIGSLKKIRVGFYNREKGVYEAKEGEGFFELVSGVGTISWKGGEPVVHVHIAGASPDGSLLLGHLLSGNIVDATVEYVIFVFDEKIGRVYDEDTGLFLLEV